MSCACSKKNYLICDFKTSTFIFNIIYNTKEIKMEINVSFSSFIPLSTFILSCCQTPYDFSLPHILSLPPAFLCPSIPPTIFLSLSMIVSCVLISPCVFEAQRACGRRFWITLLKTPTHLRERRAIDKWTDR